MKRLIRRPRPDFTTACATMNAITTSSTLALAKPEYACAGVIVPVRTMAPTASIEAVRSGNAPISTDPMAAAKTANKCHAGAVSPAGIGQNQIPSAIANGTACFGFNPSFVIWAGLPGPGRTRPFKSIGASLDRAVLGFHHPLPGELVPARRASVASSAAQDFSCDVVAIRRAFTLEFAEHLLTTLVRPDAATHQPRLAIDKRDYFGAESYARTIRTREQHRPPQVNDRATPIRAQGDGPATTCRIPRAREFQPFAGCSLRLRRLRRRSTGRRCHGPNEKDVTSRHAPRALSNMPSCQSKKAHGRHEVAFTLAAPWRDPVDFPANEIRLRRDSRVQSFVSSMIIRCILPSIVFGSDLERGGGKQVPGCQCGSHRRLAQTRITT